MSAMRVPTDDELSLELMTGLLLAHESDHERAGVERPCLDCGPLVLLHDRAAELFGVRHDPMAERRGVSAHTKKRA